MKVTTMTNNKKTLRTIPNYSNYLATPTGEIYKLVCKDGTTTLVQMEVKAGYNNYANLWLTNDSGKRECV